MSREKNMCVGVWKSEQQARNTEKKTTEKMEKKHQNQNFAMTPKTGKSLFFSVSNTEWKKVKRRKWFD